MASCAGDDQHDVRLERADLRHLDREILGVRIVGNRFHQTERQARIGHEAVHGLPLGSAEGIVGVEEHSRLRVRLCRLDEGLDAVQSVDNQLATGRKIAHQELIALLGDRRRRRNVDDERHLPLLAHLGDRQRGSGFESADNAMHAVIDHALALITGHIRI